MMATTVFVEGPSDKQFVECLLRQLNLAEIETQKIGGGFSKLQNVQNAILRERDNGRRIALILDADGNFDTRCDEVRDRVKELELPVDEDDFFLMPNHRDPGSLEEVLEQMAVGDHDAVHGCFEDYGNCLTNLKASYRKPDLKAKIYAYCEALGTEPKPDCRQYTDAGFWNLDAPVLDPLKKFLRGLAAVATRQSES